MLLFVPGWAQAPSRADVLRAIKAFEAAPLSPNMSRTYGRTILAFATESPDVTVVMNPTNFPPMAGEKLGEEEVLTLTIAYMCGDLRAQLEGGKTGEQSYPAVLSMLKVYQQMRQGKAKFRSPGLDKLVELQANGQLEAHLKSK